VIRGAVVSLSVKIPNSGWGGGKSTCVQNDVMKMGELCGGPGVKWNIKKTNARQGAKTSAVLETVLQGNKESANLGVNTLKGGHLLDLRRLQNRGWSGIRTKDAAKG